MASVSFSFNVNTRINFFYGLSLRQRANAWVNVHFLWNWKGAPGGYEECKKSRETIASISLHSVLAGIRISVGRIAVCFYWSFSFNTVRWANDEKLAKILIETSDQSKWTKCKFKLFTITQPNCPFFRGCVQSFTFFTRRKMGSSLFGWSSLIWYK